MIKLDDLPLSIFSLVQEYFLEYSCDHAYQNEFLINNRRMWNQFIRCSNSGIISEIKRNYSYYPLNRRYSYAYVVYNGGLPLEEQSEDAKVISTLLQRIENSSKQISLNFSYYDPNKKNEVERQGEIDQIVTRVTPTFVIEYAHRFKTIHGISLRWHQDLFENLDLSYFSSLYFVDLSFSEFHHTEIACLNNVKKLDCSFCSLVDELPGKSRDDSGYSLPLLSTVEEANFACTRIDDVSLLQNLKKVILCACPYLEDVSPLKNVYHVDLSECAY
jgi:energy-converting hydrogenase A subunit M